MLNTLEVRYPFMNTSGDIFGSISSDEILKFFTGENNIFGKYGSCIYNVSSGTSGFATVQFFPTFMNSSNNGFRFRMSKSTAPDGYMQFERSTTGTIYSTPVANHIVNSMFHYSKDLGNGIYGRDYTKIPFYSYETESTYMFAVDNINNFCLVTERYKIDDRSIKTCSIITRKNVAETDACPLGFYEYNDSTPNSTATEYTNLYTADKLYNAHNIGYCSTYSLYQYTRDGYIYPDIYYCDGGLSIPPDGIVRISTSMFMRLGSNLFLRIG